MLEEKANAESRRREEETAQKLAALEQQIRERTRAAAMKMGDAKLDPRLLLAPALDAALDPPADGERSADSRSWDREAIVRRADPATYDDLYGRPLREVKEEIKTLGKPLAPQSVASLDELFARFEGEARFDEEAFILAELVGQ